MSVYKYAGILRPPLTYIGAIGLEQKKVNLYPVSKITFKFDPFHPNSAEFRSLMFIFSVRKIRETNLACKIKTDIVCDLSEPEVHCKLTNGSQLLFKAGYLNTLQILAEFNHHLQPLQLPPPEAEDSKKVVKTKSQKASLKK